MFLSRLATTSIPATMRLIKGPLVNGAFRGMASVGDSLPSVELHQGFPPKKYNLADFAKDKSIILVGLPGAFTPT